MTNLAPVWARIHDLAVESASGCWIQAVDGNKYLDFTSGIAVTNTGHCHPAVVRAISDQANRFIHAQVNVYQHDLLEPLAAALREVTPASIDTFFYANSGAEAVEGSIKLARRATGKQNVVVFDGSFHGRTFLAMAMTTAKSVYRAGYAPLPSGVHVAPFPRVYETGTVPTVNEALRALDHLFETVSAPEETAAVVIEPILGEGGYWPAPLDFLRGVEEVCRRRGVLFVVDEVQTGFGRTGSLFASDRYGIAPDILIMGKGAASGLPFAAIGAGQRLMDQWPAGSHGSTYGGNPIAAAAALATIGIVADPDTLHNVNERSAQLLAGLEELRVVGARHIRGHGLMVGMTVTTREGQDDPERVKRVINHSRTHGHLLIMHAGTHGESIRLMPPLTVSATEVDLALGALESAFGATAS